MEESGCIPPCHINANEVEEKGLIDEPRHNPQTDLIIKVYNTKDFKVQSLLYSGRDIPKETFFFRRSKKTIW